jgi:transaldolase/glucose-6-phosphate isomerase
VFLQITCDERRDIPVPGQQYTFGVVKAAQARGDFDVLLARERRALRVHLGADVTARFAHAPARRACGAAIMRMNGLHEMNGLSFHEGRHDRDE